MDKEELKKQIAEIIANKLNKPKTAHQIMDVVERQVMDVAEEIGPVFFLGHIAVGIDGSSVVSSMSEYPRESAIYRIAAAMLERESLVTNGADAVPIVALLRSLSEQHARKKLIALGGNPDGNPDAEEAEDTEEAPCSEEPEEEPIH